MQIHGRLVDLHTRTIRSCLMEIQGKNIASIQPNTHRTKGFILPGFIDSCLRIESSMLTPSEFARIAVRHGTVAAVCDSHAIENVLGESGAQYLTTNAQKTSFKFFFKAPPSQIPTSLSEARELHHHGKNIFVREGSGVKSFRALFPLLQEDPGRCLLCSEDLSPNDLLLGHLNLLVKRAVKHGMDPLDALLSVSKNPIDHYGLNVGLLREGDLADFIIVEDLISFRVLQTYINGQCVFQGESLLPRIHMNPINRFHPILKTPSHFQVNALEGTLKVIEALDGDFLTKRLDLSPTIAHGLAIADPSRDLLKIVVVNRYQDAPIAIGFVKNFGLKQGAIGSSVSHDSPHVVAVGASDQDLCTLVNAIIEAKGGVGVSNKNRTDVLPLPIAGLMSTLDGEEVARRYGDLEEAAKGLGCTLKAPFIILSYMTLLQVPELKMSEKGLFDPLQGCLTPLFT